MASLRNAMKTQRVHKERHQSLARNHLGPLEKKKDYKVRAKDKSKKKEAIKLLHKRALNKNPDEFHYHMINSQIKNGVHIEKVEDEELTIGNVNEDLTYIIHRRSVERKKIEKLKAQLHLILDDGEPKNTHIIFVDSEKEAKQITPAQALNTHPALINRTFNRLTTDQLKSHTDTLLLQRDALKGASQERRKSYKKLSQLMKRENKLRILQEKLEVKKKLMENKKKSDSTKPKLMQAGSSTSAPVYEWPQERKR